MPSSVTLLGFDLRALGARHAEGWAEARRRDFLLRRDAEPVLSVDVAAWPSLFDTGQGIGMDAAERERHGLAGLKAPAWTGANAGLWDDVEAMRRYATTQPGWRPPAHAVIAIAWHRQQGVDAGHAGPHPTVTRPPRVDPGWPLLGFDVADGSLVSGLSNCGYRAEERAALAPRWAPRLSRYHLFDAAADALAFRETADARVPEHAPFFVYAIHLVPETAAPLAPARSPGALAPTGGI